MPDIREAKILIVATDGFEESELTVPQAKLKQAGATVTVASPQSRQSKETIRGWDKTDWGKDVPVDLDLESVNPEDYDALVLPGGQINPDKLRMEDKAVALVKAFVDSGKPVAAICHGPWLLVEADVLGGRTVTSWPSIRTDLKNAGANVVDQEAVTDGNIVTSRKPDDIPAFTKALQDLLQKVGEPA
jgi:protease I